MRLNNISMTTTVKKPELLTKLRANLEDHHKVLQEAFLGYIKSAKEAINDKLDALKAGKPVSLHFSLQPPSDHSDCYRAVIKMLEWSQDETIVLRPDEFRQLVMNEWDWMESWYDQNKSFSATASVRAK